MSNILKYSLLAFLVYSLFWVWLISSFIDVGPTFIRVASVVSFQMVFFYLNLYYLLPKFLDGQAKTNYFFLTAIIVLISTGFGGFIDYYLDKHFPFSFHNITDRPLYSLFLARFVMTMMPLVVSALVFKSIQVRNQKEESLELKNKMLEAESQALKAQINPHFLFNSLNNIYSLAQIKSDKTPNAILHLSDILRFVTYESSQDKVSVKDEIKLIESFIQLQYLKDDNHSNISVEIKANNEQSQIAPLLLIPFIENSFKHGNHEDKENGWIKIDLKMDGRKLIMTCANSASNKINVKDKTGGVGLENVKKRLALLYPGKHKLTIKDDLKSYLVNLEIDLV